MYEIYVDICVSMSETDLNVWRCRRSYLRHEAGLYCDPPSPSGTSSQMKRKIGRGTVHACGITGRSLGVWGSATFGRLRPHGAANESLLYTMLVEDAHHRLRRRAENTIEKNQKCARVSEVQASHR